MNQLQSIKHAYLIIAHTNWAQLQKLISVLDDIRNDIYIHVDLKSRESFERYFNKLGGG